MLKALLAVIFGRAFFGRGVLGMIVEGVGFQSVLSDFHLEAAVAFAGFKGVEQGAAGIIDVYFELLVDGTGVYADFRSGPRLYAAKVEDAFGAA